VEEGGSLVRVYWDFYWCGGVRVDGVEGDLIGGKIREGMDKIRIEGCIKGFLSLGVGNI